MTDLFVFNDTTHLSKKERVCEGEKFDLCNGMVVSCGTQ